MPPRREVVDIILEIGPAHMRSKPLGACLGDAMGLRPISQTGS